MIANAILLVISEIGVRRAEEAAHILIVLRMLVLVAYLKPDRGSCRFAFEYTTQKLHLVSFPSGRSDMALSRASAVQLALDKVHVDFNACRKSVNNASYSYSMTLAKSSESEKITKCIPHYLIYYKRCLLLVAAAFATTLAVAILAVATAVVAAT